MQTLFGLIVFALDIWAIASIINSSVDTTKKVLWILGVLLFPIIGFLVWYFAGPKAS